MGMTKYPARRIRADPERPIKDFAQSYAHVFHGVVLIHIQVTGGCEVQIESSMRANNSSMWSRKRIPVETSYFPRPSMVSAIRISVSAVLR